MDQQQALHLLRDADEGSRFCFNNGKTATSIEGLLRGIVTLNDKEYYHHVYPDHNDFSNWLIDIIGDSILARDIFNADKQQTIALMKARLRFLREHE